MHAQTVFWISFLISSRFILHHLIRLFLNNWVTSEIKFKLNEFVFLHDHFILFSNLTASKCIFQDKILIDEIVLAL